MSRGRDQMDVLIVGAGMIVADLILPAVLQLKREGSVGRGNGVRCNRLGHPGLAKR